MQGVIKSYSAEKGFGFVDGADGVSYFLHKNQLADKSQISQLIIGASIEFDAMPTPKGMQANGVSVLKTIIGKAMPEFQITRKSAIPGTEIAWELPVVWPFVFSDFNKAEAEIISFVKSNGANAILNFKIEKETGQSGNYHFTVGRPTFTIAMVTKNVQVEDQNAVDELNVKLELSISHARQRIEQLIDMKKRAAEAAYRPGRRVFANAMIALFFIILGWLWSR